MKRIFNKHWTSAFIVVLTTTLFLASCKKEDNGPDYKIVVFTEEVSKLSTGYITSLLGTISIAYPEASQLTPFVNGDVTVHRIVYNTEVYGVPVEASGLVCIPDTKGSYPVLCFLNGTNTLNADAPSVNPLSFSYQMIEGVASMGYIVVIPDYPGFGASSDILHPYLLAEPTIESVVDAIRAAGEFAGKGLSGYEAEKELYFYGYSQGGWAALTMHKAIELSYPQEFTLMGSACGAGAYDLEYLNGRVVELETFPSPMYMAYIAHAYKTWGKISLPLSDIFRPDYASIIPSLFDGLHSAGQINSALTTNVENLFTENYIDNYNDQQFAPIRAALISNSVAPWKTMKPVFLIHGTTDNQVLPEVTTLMHEAMITAGTGVTVCTSEMLPGLDHSTALIPASIRSLLFLNAIKGN